MRGFKIICLTQVGEVAMRDNVSANKTVFHVVEINSSPLEYEFLLKNGAMRKMFSLVPPSEIKRHISQRLVGYGAIEERDYVVQVIDDEKK